MNQGGTPGGHNNGEGKVWRPGDADEELGKGHEKTELELYDLFEDEAIPDTSAQKLNYQESTTYDLLRRAVAAQVAQMREMLKNHEAKEKEREWKRGLPDGELDDMRLVEAACGDQNVFRRRQDSKNAALLASKPKRILIACDLSPSMSVLDRIDDRLRRLQEALVFIFESFTGFMQKYDYQITGYSAAGYDYVFVPWTKPPRSTSQRLAVLERMVSHARHAPSGDGTLSATEWAVKEVRKREGDEYFVFVISDCELNRHDISPPEWNKLLMADPQVNAYAIIISMSSAETKMFLDGIDKGHGFACQERDELAGIFKKVFQETLDKDKP
uniref:VWFA domain-containing protein n=1 Tax=Alexandrium monilatum TaxID=311494 RepID=A0A7S4QLC2_9DINO